MPRQSKVLAGLEDAVRYARSGRAANGGGRIPALGYPSRTAAALALKLQGRSMREIADQLGIEPKNAAALVYSAERQKGGRRRRKRSWEGVVRTVCIDRGDLEMLEPQAAKRGIHVNELVRRLIYTIAEEGLTDSVLDDADEGHS